MPTPLLQVIDLRAGYRSDIGFVRAVDGVSLEVPEGGSLGLVGESGCGKSSVVKSIIKVFPKSFRIESGQIEFRGTDLVPLDYEQMRHWRGKEISLIPQSAMNALNPVYTVGYQVAEVILEHERVSRGQAMNRVRQLFEWVGIDPDRTGQYPHQFSGGMRQRVNIALALALEPALVIADEPTTALDVVVQDQIFGKMREMRDRTGASMLLVTHDISLVSENCDTMAVMYAGQIVEYSDVRGVLARPFHPYTLGLKNAFPSVDRPRNEALISIPKTPPSLLHPPEGCRFAPRCPFATDRCVQEAPVSIEVERGHFVSCHHVGDIDRMREAAEKAETWAARE